jgi:acetylornithine deacetylase/succinyl-diaminopimelate desuccinylase-like protein
MARVRRAMAMNRSQASSGALRSVLDRLAREEPAALERLFRLLAIPSISTDPAFHESCIDAAEACAGALREIGFEARVEPTLGKPMVVGHWRATPLTEKRRHVLFYGHYDVQPPEPLEEWSAPPFDPRLVEDPRYGTVIVARGASDDKGQLMTFIEAARAWLEEHGELPSTSACSPRARKSPGVPALPVSGGPWR